MNLAAALALATGTGGTKQDGRGGKGDAAAEEAALRAAAAAAGAGGKKRRYPQVDSFHRIRTPEKKSWLPRLKFVSQTMNKKFCDCDVTIALDSHVTVCSSNLGDRLDSFHAARRGG